MILIIGGSGVLGNEIISHLLTTDDVLILCNNRHEEVLKKFSRNTFLGIPLTLREKTGTYYFETNIRGIRRWLILSQARTFDSKRLRESLGELDENTLKRVREEFAKLICS